MNKRFRTLLKHWSWLLLIELVLLLLFGLIAGPWLTVRDTVDKADLIWVLGGDSVDFHRTKHGLELRNRGVADTVLFTGFGLDLDNTVDQAIQWGIPRGKAVPIDSCLSTVDEAKKGKEYVQSHRITSLVFVTDIYHTRRAKNTFEKFLPGVTIYSSPAHNTNYNERWWWKTEEGFVAVFAEVLKNVYYVCAYGVV